MRIVQTMRASKNRQVCLKKQEDSTRIHICKDSRNSGGCCSSTETEYISCKKYTRSKRECVRKCRLTSLLKLLIVDHKFSFTLCATCSNFVYASSAGGRQGAQYMQVS